MIFIGNPAGKKWVLIDAGMPAGGSNIASEAADRFGDGTAPEAILLTHGHFDHVGGIVHLLQKWPNVPVFAHPMEFPFLTGAIAYPEPDPTVEGGMLAKIEKIYPHEPVQIAERLQPFPADGTVPFLPDWRWFHTPGHSPGHVSFFRESDRVLVAGDAFVTVQ